MHITGKVAVVTGAGSGIGRGLALALARAHCKLIAADIDEVAARAVASEISNAGGVAIGVHCDVARFGSVEALADFTWATFGTADLLFNNAGGFSIGPGLDQSEADLRWLFEVNVFGTWYGTSVFGKRFIAERKRGWICCTASDTAVGMSSAGLALYGSTKHALLGMYDVLRHDYAGKIGFSVLCPGATDTQIWNAARYKRDAAPEGQASVFVRQATALGLDPLWIGELAVAGVCAEEFLIITHPHIADLARTRCAAIMEATARQWPDGPTEAHRLSQDGIAKLAASLPEAAARTDARSSRS